MSTAGKGACSSCSVAHKFSWCDALCAAQQRKIKAASATKRVPIASEVPLFLSRAAFQLHYVSFTGCISSTCSLIWAISTCRRCQPETNVGLWRSWESSILRCRLARCRITLREQHPWDITLWYIHHSTRIIIPLDARVRKIRAARPRCNMHKISFCSRAHELFAPHQNLDHNGAAADQNPQPRSHWKPHAEHNSNASPCY